MQVMHRQHQALTARCRAANCKQNHFSHYCKNCQNDNADHCKWQCPLGLKKCRAAHCKQSHSSHYCKNCKEDDADHCSRQCPKKINPQHGIANRHYYPNGKAIKNPITVYHGTSKDAADNILKNGFIPSTSGNKGAGIYFAIERKVSQNYARSKYSIYAVVFECIISSDQLNGPWDNSNPFIEYVVQDPQRIKIVKLQDA